MLHCDQLIWNYKSVECLVYSNTSRAHRRSPANNVTMLTHRFDYIKSICLPSNEASMTRRWATNGSSPNSNKHLFIHSASMQCRMACCGFTALCRHRGLTPRFQIPRKPLCHIQRSKQTVYSPSMSHTHTWPHASPLSIWLWTNATPWLHRRVQFPPCTRLSTNFRLDQRANINQDTHTHVH